jgi:hypothetical protein
MVDHGVVMEVEVAAQAAEWETAVVVVGEMEGMVPAGTMGNSTAPTTKMVGNHETRQKWYFIMNKFEF